MHVCMCEGMCLPWHVHDDQRVACRISTLLPPRESEDQTRFVRPGRKAIAFYTDIVTQAPVLMPVQHALYQLSRPL